MHNRDGPGGIQYLVVVVVFIFNMVKHFNSQSI